ncbi:hypothetical protein BLA27_26470 [Brucella cytisi]|uniref:Uncharacterized protein n=1 Tax=Brucella cytisi TaxID=407152 RepID=A0A1J6HV78_9HYPH|nr:hypothetical protein BLA27_26470 [Brucella cytisi]
MHRRAWADFLLAKAESIDPDPSHAPDKSGGDGMATGLAKRLTAFGMVILREAISVYWTLVKIMLPVMVLTQLAIEMGLIKGHFSCLRSRHAVRGAAA